MVTKDFYLHYHDQITDKRFNSPFPLRRYVHRLNYEILVQHAAQWVPDGGRILDAGCGDGQLSRLMYLAVKDRGVTVTAADISVPNVQFASRIPTPDEGKPLQYQVADAENLPYSNGAFDVVVSSHVLEHLPSFAKGLAELHRLTKRIAIVALPTCFNASAAVQLGGGIFWHPSPRSLFGLVKGSGRILLGLGSEGVDEGYAGQDVPHVWRYPWVMRKQLEAGGFKVLSFEGGSLAIPFIPAIIPPFLEVQKMIDRLRAAPVFRNFGYGSIAVLEKQ